MAIPTVQRRHSLAVRAMHWINALAFVLLLMSGLQIFNAHPALYWGQSSYSGRPPLMQIEGFPAWITIPGEQWLAMGRRWHLFFAWVLVLNGLVYLAYTIASRHLARDLAPTRTDWRGIGRSIADHQRAAEARLSRGHLRAFPAHGAHGLGDVAGPGQRRSPLG
jgi:thiosulfate reductase cytochrome b subunit